MPSKAESPQFISEDEKTEIKKSGAGRPPGAKNKKKPGTSDEPTSKADLQMAFNELFNGLAFLIKSDASFVESEFAKQAELYARMAERFPFVQRVLKALLPLAAFAQTINTVRKLFGGVKPNSHEPKVSWLEKRRLTKEQARQEVASPEQVMNQPRETVPYSNPMIPPQA